MNFDVLVTDGPVVSSMTNAGNAGLMVPMIAFAVAVAWVLVRKTLKHQDRVVLWGEFWGYLSWFGYRLFWTLGVIEAQGAIGNCSPCVQVIKQASYASFAWDWRGIVTMLASIGVAYSSAMKASAMIDEMQCPYWKATWILGMSWVAGALSPTYGFTPIFCVIACCVALIVIRFEVAHRRKRASVLL